MMFVSHGVKRRACGQMLANGRQHAGALSLFCSRSANVCSCHARRKSVFWVRASDAGVMSILGRCARFRTASVASMLCSLRESFHRSRCTDATPLLAEGARRDWSRITPCGPRAERGHKLSNKATHFSDAPVTHCGALQHSRDPRAPLVQGGTGPCESIQAEGRVALRAFVSPALSAAVPFAVPSTTSARRCRSSSGMSIFTGQTSRQAPHKLDAKGNCAVLPRPISCGVITAPIGPG